VGASGTWEALEPLLELEVARFALVLTLRHTALLPRWPANEIRGLLKQGLRRVLCFERRRDLSCSACPAAERTCGYPLLVGEGLRAPWCRELGVDRPPAPWGLHWFDACAEDAHETIVYPPGSRIRVGLTLFGAAVRALPHFVHALETIGSHPLLGRRIRTRFELTDVQRLPLAPGASSNGESEARDPGREALSVETMGDAVRARLERLSRAPLTRLRLVSPLRIIQHDRPLRRVDPALILERSHHRLRLLVAQQYGRLPPPLPPLRQTPRGVDEQLSYLPWARPGRGRRRHPYGGIIGRLTLSQLSPPTATLIAIAEITHVGRGATMGLGQISALPLH
jgi:hypothetical protein